MSAPWNAKDIGSPAVPGSASFAQGQFTITAEDSDIWGNFDQFTFVYQQVTGDVDVIARVDSVSMADQWSKAGVMIRGSLSPDAAQAFALSSAGKGVAFQRRPQAGGLSASTAAPVLAAPHWVRLLRKGTLVTAYMSADGKTWRTIGSATIGLGSVAYVGLAVTSHDLSARATAVLSQVAVVPLSLPSVQRAIDIGKPAIQGSTSYRAGIYTIQAGGDDIWDASDQFHFVCQPITGDVDVRLRVRSISRANKWSKTGVMIRESLAVGSRHAFALLSAGEGYAFQRRVATAGISDDTAGPLLAPPGWVRLVRQGSQIEAFRSADGITWTSMGSDAIPMAATVYVGIAATSHNTAAATTAVVDGLSISTPGAAENQPPLVAITAPANGTTVTAGNNVSVTAGASDADGTVSRVDFFAGTKLIGSDTTQPYGITWPSVAAGAYTLTAVATDNDGAATTSSSVSVQAQTAANTPPTVTLTAPANGSAYAAPGTVTISATASDPNGTIARVLFYAGTTLLNTDTVAPYTFTWRSVAAGTYGIRAVAYDNGGASASSATNTITVSTATTTLPRAIMFHASADHATLVTSYELRIYASGANPGTAIPLVTSNLGKPALDVNGDITVDRSALFTALAPGTYVAAVSAIGSGGTTISAGSTFTR